MSDPPVPECVFCRIASGGQASIVHDDLSIAFMDTKPINTGHVLVIPKQHYPYLADVPSRIGAHCFSVAQRVAAAIRGSGLRCSALTRHLAGRIFWEPPTPVSGSSRAAGTRGKYRRSPCSRPIEPRVEPAWE
jgi:HIT domain